MLATIVDTSALWQTIVAAFVAGVGTTLVFSLAILGLPGSPRRPPGPLGSVGGLAALALLGSASATAAAIVFGVIVMTTK